MKDSFKKNTFIANQKTAITEWTYKKCARFPLLCKVVKGAAYLAVAVGIYNVGHKVGRVDQYNSTKNK